MTTMKTAFQKAAAAKTQAPVVKSDSDFIETPNLQQGAVFATADMVRTEDGGRIIEVRFKVVGDLLSMTESGRTATQWCKIDIGGTNKWQMAMTLFVPSNQLTPDRFAAAVARRKDKLAKLNAKAKPDSDMVD